MLTRLLGGLLLLLLFFAVLAIVALQQGGIAGLLVVIGLFVLSTAVIRKLLGRLLERASVEPFQMKGAVLKEAAVQVHSVTPVPAPAFRETDEEAPPEDESEEEPRDWYSLDVTITPSEPTGDFTTWEPSELGLAAPDAEPEPSEEAADEYGQVDGVEVWKAGFWADDDEEKYAGQQRLRLRVGVPTGIRRARFRYYFELFGDLELPGPSEPTA